MADRLLIVTWGGPKVSVTLGEALERVRQDIERLPWLPRLIMRRRWRKGVERMERLRNESLANYACPLSCECEGGGEE